MTTTTSAILPRLDVQVRWLIRRDLEEVLEISRTSPMPWSEEEFLTALRQRNAIGMVAESADDRIVGYVIYELARNQIEITNLAVDESCQHRKVGTALFSRIVNKLAVQRRRSIITLVNERNLTAQLFLRSMDCYCREIVPGDESDDYLFEYRLEDSCDAD